MIFTETKLKGAYVIDIKRYEDDRGFFARSWCQREFETHGLDTRIVQCDISFNAKKGTLRGMHYRVPPFEETKIMRCTRGTMFVVIVDLRRDSSTFKQYLGFTLSAENRRMLYILKKFANGFQTLEDNTEVFYQMYEFYTPEGERGFRWNDPEIDIEWPANVNVISERDKNYPDLDL